MDKESRNPLSHADLSGVTFYASDPQHTRLIVDGQEVSEVQCNPPDHTGCSSVSLPWPRLMFPNP
jgi:hypothetical protein